MNKLGPYHSTGLGAGHPPTPASKSMQPPAQHGPGPPKKGKKEKKKEAPVQLEGVGAVAVRRLLLQILWQVDDHDGIKGALLRVAGAPGRGAAAKRLGGTRARLAMAAPAALLAGSRARGDEEGWLVLSLGPVGPPAAAPRQGGAAPIHGAPCSAATRAVARRPGRRARHSRGAVHGRGAGGLTLTQMPQPMHRSSEIQAILSLAVTSTHSLPTCNGDVAGHRVGHPGGGGGGRCSGPPALPLALGSGIAGGHTAGTPHLHHRAALLALLLAFLGLAPARHGAGGRYGTADVPMRCCCCSIECCPTAAHHQAALFPLHYFAAAVLVCMSRD